MDIAPLPAMEEQGWWSEKTVALVTGANKGIGLQLVREFSKRGITTILTSRDEEKGRKVAEKLKAEEGLRVVFHQLDVRVPTSVQELVDWLSKEYSGLDILVNNAGICSVPGCSAVDCSNRVEAAQHVLNTNYYGVKRMIEGALPILKPGARIVNLSSKCGDLDYLKNDWGARLNDTSKLTELEIDECLEQFLTDVAENQIEARGWPVSEVSFSGDVEHTSDYSLSKAVLNAYTRLKSESVELKQRSVSINCTCPGITSTELVHFYGHPVEIGADTAVWLALLPPDVAATTTGQFFTARKNVGFTGMPFHYNGELMDFTEAFKRLL